jgi:hypothetical protein
MLLELVIILLPHILEDDLCKFSVESGNLKEYELP